MFTMFLLLLLVFYVMDIESDLREANNLKEEQMEESRETSQRHEKLLTEIKKDCKKNSKKQINKKTVYRRSITTQDGVTYAEEVEK